jgi:hypothetical protein
LEVPGKCQGSQGTAEARSDHDDVEPFDGHSVESYRKLFHRCHRLTNDRVL